ncbi:MAG: AAA family ATPase [Synechococcales cyanobacterium RU_4_20]|nr:AAA family ATPase [Synechococcales cyanobacterium RU_4_20]
MQIPKAHFDQMNGALPGQQQELHRLSQELEQRSQWAEQREQLQQTLGNKQRILQFVSDARRIYNQSGPRITQFYLNEIVREGDRLFRELINRQNAALNWTQDYEIQIQEGSVWRSFKTLSGGEQMAAALAVRLALLKVLADLDIAFFDEPTTNMDKPRREQLAEALSQLKAFSQLFVISHDDTFETITDSVIRVERQPG